MDIEVRAKLSFKEAVRVVVSCAERDERRNFCLRDAEQLEIAARLIRDKLDETQ